MGYNGIGFQSVPVRLDIWFLWFPLLDSWFAPGHSPIFFADRILHLTLQFIQDAYDILRQVNLDGMKKVSFIPRPVYLPSKRSDTCFWDIFRQRDDIVKELGRYDEDGLMSRWDRESRVFTLP